MSALAGSVSALVGTRLVSSIPNCERPSARLHSAQRNSLIVCQANSNDLPDEKQAESKRRSLLLAAATTVLAASALLNEPDAEAKRKPPPPPEPKKQEDDRNLGALDAKKLANARRKEAMKAMLESAKAKAKQEPQESVKAPTTMAIEATSN
ncbi:hypothetical protein R1sor_014414 [Riccia sorocarpa]|uniref:Uncharacterized protein n=1 Tax=Riccia sorocarpa TaxID=122646 RepID=A0ABD3HCH8_9MARC